MSSVPDNSAGNDHTFIHPYLMLQGGRTTMTIFKSSEGMAGSSDKLLCLTICGYRKPGMSEEDYKHHMTKISAPMTQDLMVKYGVIHNPHATRALMGQLFDSQMANIADFDCFSQVVFRRLEDYKRMKQDPWYQQHLLGDHEQFADTKRSMMTIGWISQFVDHGVVVDGIEASSSRKDFQATAVLTGMFLSGAMTSLSLMAVPVFLDTTTVPGQLFHQWVRLYHYGHQVLPTLAVVTFSLYGYSAWRRRKAKKSWGALVLAGLTTVAMLPFTWLVMVPTNNILFALEASSRASGAVATMEEARALVTKWCWMHLARSLFPLAGAVIGMVQILVA
ncbi:hypothetical protein EYZ11_007065 [Aspergillus tanneri]|uniref:EthD domain-containing protein n=1 Tax=Aspergillus tanneri TaxID=1220188 RepID=A0A4S3JDV7_9EURO|nr:hypothetical protein EYZ11_007065 [Aspergillus tanneri]